MQVHELKPVPRPGQRFSLQFLLFGFIPFKLTGLDSAPSFGYPTVQGHTFVAAITAGKSRVMGEKVSPVPIPEAWMKRIGTWAPVPADGTDDSTLYATLRRDGEFLMLDIVIGNSTAAVWALFHLGDGEVVIAGAGCNLGETILAQTSGGEERLMFSRCEFKRRAS